MRSGSRDDSGATWYDAGRRYREAGKCSASYRVLAGCTWTGLGAGRIRLSNAKTSQRC